MSSFAAMVDALLNENSFNSNFELRTMLVNRAPAIRDLVRAAEHTSAHGTGLRALRESLAKLEEV